MRISDWSSDVLLFRSLADTAGYRVILDVVHINSLTDQACNVVRKARRLCLPPLAKGEAGGILPVQTIIDGIAPQQNVEIAAGPLHGMRDPDDRVVLLLERCAVRSEEHTSELQSLMRISYAVFCLKKKKIN